MIALRGHLGRWWSVLTHPLAASRVILDAQPGFTPVLLGLIAILYASYGFSMGLFRCDPDLGLLRGLVPAMVSAVKLPLLYLLGLAVCFPPLYTLNCVLGPRLRPKATFRLTLLAVSANAVAVASYTPFGLFFTLTTSRSGYSFLVLMHLAVFALAGAASVVVIALIFRSTANALRRPLDGSFLFAWSITYGVVMAQMSWILRPWIGAWNLPYTPIRRMEGNFVEGVIHLLNL